MKILEVVEFSRKRDQVYKHIERYSYSALIRVRSIPWLFSLSPTKIVEVACDAGGVHWYFTSNGEYTPGFTVESMARAERRKRDW